MPAVRLAAGGSGPGSVGAHGLLWVAWPDAELLIQPVMITSNTTQIVPMRRVVFLLFFIIISKLPGYLLMLQIIEDLVV